MSSQFNLCSAALQRDCTATMLMLKVDEFVFDKLQKHILTAFRFTNKIILFYFKKTNTNLKFATALIFRITLYLQLNMPIHLDRQQAQFCQNFVATLFTQ